MPLIKEFHIIASRCATMNVYDIQSQNSALNRHRTFVDLPWFLRHYLHSRKTNTIITRFTPPCNPFPIRYDLLFIAIFGHKFHSAFWFVREWVLSHEQREYALSMRCLHIVAHCCLKSIPYWSFDFAGISRRSFAEPRLHAAKKKHPPGAFFFRQGMYYWFRGGKSPVSITWHGLPVRYTIDGTYECIDSHCGFHHVSTPLKGRYVTRSRRCAMDRVEAATDHPARRIVPDDNDDRDQNNFKYLVWYRRCGNWGGHRGWKGSLSRHLRTTSFPAIDSRNRISEGCARTNARTVGRTDTKHVFCKCACPPKFPQANRGKTATRHNQDLRRMEDLSQEISVAIWRLVWECNANGHGEACLQDNQGQGQVPPVRDRYNTVTEQEERRGR